MSEESLDVAARLLSEEVPIRFDSKYCLEIPIKEICSIKVDALVTFYFPEDIKDNFIPVELCISPSSDENVVSISRSNDDDAILMLYHENTTLHYSVRGGVDQIRLLITEQLKHFLQSIKLLQTNYRYCPQMNKFIDKPTVETFLCDFLGNDVVFGKKSVGKCVECKRKCRLKCAKGHFCCVFCVQDRKECKVENCHSMTFTEK